MKRRSPAARRRGSRHAGRIVRVRALYQQRAYLEAILESLPAEGDIAYAVIVDRKGDVVAGGASPSAGRGSPPARRRRVLPAAGATSTTEVTIRGRRYFEQIAPVGGSRSRPQWD
jgi:hypothetical protein